VSAPGAAGRQGAAGHSRVAVWIHGARPRTLSASVAPVVVGTAAAVHVEAWRFVAALLVGVGLQVGVNFANDFHDGVRGVDTSERLGPPRLTASGMASPRAVMAASLACIAIAGLAGLALAAATTWWLIPLGAVAMLALWLYSGGPRPYAELGLGELIVFVFFGLMATVGSTYVQTEAIPRSAWWCGGAMGMLAVAILVANNLRDIPTDALAGKRTLAVRLGDARTRVLYRACLVAAFATVVIGVVVGDLPGAALIALTACVVAARPFSLVGSASGRELIAVLVGTGLLQTVFAALLAVGLWAGVR
jgi:1,4-dihydroxy-2-naphthoate polyprenyltransferase